MQHMFHWGIEPIWLTFYYSLVATNRMVWLIWYFPYSTWRARRPLSVTKVAQKTKKKLWLVGYWSVNSSGWILRLHRVKWLLSGCTAYSLPYLSSCLSSSISSCFFRWPILLHRFSCPVRALVLSLFLLPSLRSLCAVGSAAPSRLHRPLALTLFSLVALFARGCVFLACPFASQF